MIEEFEKFVNSFDINEKKIKLKYSHSLRVQKLCEAIAQDEKFDEHDFKVASVVGLLHDYGRFYQWTKYKTFKDKISIDHGDYAASELFENGKIKDFYQNEDDYQIIYEAIKYHNKYEVSKNVISKTMCDIIRDADKLDILYMYTINELKLEEDGEISEKVKKIFYNHQLLNNKYVNSKIDKSIRTLCLVYDLNFKYSYKYLKENKIIQNIYEILEQKEKFKPYFDEINKFIESKIGD